MLRRPKHSTIEVVAPKEEEEEEGVDWIDLAQDRTSGGICEHGNEISGCTKCGGFLDLLRNYSILRKDLPAQS
jgi:hypothetical protein